MKLILTDPAGVADGLVAMRLTNLQLDNLQISTTKIYFHIRSRFDRWQKLGIF